MLSLTAMKKHPVGTIVNFCTNESRFIQPCLEQALLFSSQIVVIVASHFFDGTPENRELLNQIYRAFPECLFVEYPFAPASIPPRVFRTVRPDAFWHCISRLIGVMMLEDHVESALFLDADEVPDGVRLSEWLDCSDYEHHVALKLANYWYFREPIYRARALEDSAVLVQKRALTADLLLHDQERDAIYDSLPGPKRRMVMGTDGSPMLHHFSWVRTEEEMLKKVRSWSHRKDRDWETLVREEFLAPFKGTDFVHGYRFDTVAKPFAMPKPLFEPRGKENVRRISENELRAFAKKKKIPLRRRFSFLP